MVRASCSWTASSNDGNEGSVYAVDVEIAEGALEFAETCDLVEVCEREL